MLNPSPTQVSNRNYACATRREAWMSIDQRSMDRGLVDGPSFFLRNKQMVKKSELFQPLRIRLVLVLLILCELGEAFVFGGFCL